MYIKKLLQAGASNEIKNVENWTPYQMVEEEISKYTVALPSVETDRGLERLQIVKGLFDQ